MSQSWQLSDAKRKFSALVNQAIAGEPQIITKYGQEVVVGVAIDEYREYERPKSKLSEVFTKSPLVSVNIDLRRDKS